MTPCKDLIRTAKAPRAAQIGTSRDSKGNYQAILYGHPVACASLLDGVQLRHHGFITSSTTRTMNAALEQWSVAGRVGIIQGEMWFINRDAGFAKKKKVEAGWTLCEWMDT